MCTPLDGKIRRKITKNYENIETRRSKVIKERNSRVYYFTNTCFFACLFFACLSAFLFYRVPHCKGIEIRSLSHIHQACFLFAWDGGGTIQRRDGQKCARGALGESRGMPHGKFWNLGCLWYNFCVLRAVWCENKIKKVDITQTVNALTAVGSLMTPIDFTLSNARQFYSLMENPSAVKGLNLRMDFFGPRTSLCVHFTVLKNVTIKKEQK